MKNDPATNPTLDAMLAAQRIAFAPVMFQVARVMRNRGVLKALQRAGKGGRTPAEVAQDTGLSAYAAKTLLEASLSFGLVERAGGANVASGTNAHAEPRERGERYTITRVGLIVENDRMTRINMDFIHDVCYEGMRFLDEAIEGGKPAGLKVFGEWPTVYEALPALPPKVRESWFAFDHLYSDSAFPEALPVVFERRPRTLLDIGGNTGRWAIQCCTHDPDVRVTVLDLPGQLEDARVNVERHGLLGRIMGTPIDFLDHGQAFPTGFDAIWMSQFLVCFSEADIVQILRRAASAMGDETVLWILDTFWDRQTNEVAVHCLHGSSLYFTCLANGNSRMYSAADIRRCIDEAGLVVEAETDHLGLAHTLLRCRRRDAPAGKRA
ncbi:class I SAM-dependent methyltransferase [Sorangium sp. So ce448]|uniref:class I SAM-dependent methyltransferase n=1 Tax=Sorangium sp. So ce448 TaxID=3133314 RepID=UPI003F5F81B7